MLDLRRFRNFSLALVLLAVFAGHASAIVVSGKEVIVGLLSEWSERPAEIEGSSWSDPLDIPYDNVGQRVSFGGIYLGNSWVLTAKHVGAGPIVLNGTSYSYDPGTLHYITNPTGITGLDEPYADLCLYRLTEEPGLPAVEIASELPDLGATVYYIGYGGEQASTMSYWDVDTGQWPYVWTPGDPSSYYWGYYTGAGAKDWGKETIAYVENGPNKVNDVIEIAAIATDTASLTMKTVFDTTILDAQATIGDSGGSLFYQDQGGDWVLGGIISCIQYPTGAPTRAIRDASTYSVALSYYHDQIMDIVDPEIPGDATGDGVVDSSDLAVLANYWQHATDLGPAAGDFDRSGFVDSSDLAILANYWQFGTAMLADFENSLGNHTVPEPSVWGLLLGLLSLVFWRFRKSMRIS